MTLQFAAIPDKVRETVTRYMESFAPEESICLYGKGASPKDVEATHAIAWGCERLSPEHAYIEQGCSLPKLASALYGATTSNRPSPLPLWQGWQLDLVRKQLIRETAETIDLTEKEVALLAYFMAHPNISIEKSPLLEAIWGYDSAIDTSTLETHIYRLRQKLEPIRPSAEHGILTEADGYRWQA